MLEHIITYPSEVSKHYVGQTAQETARNHAFRVYSHGCNWVWKPIFVASTADALLDTAFTPVVTKVLAGAAFFGASFFYGAFWSKLGTMQEVKRSYQDDRKKTVCSIVKNSVLGNFYDISYMPILGSDIVYGQISDLLNHSSPIVRKIGKAAYDVCLRTSLAAYAIAW